MRQRDRGRKDAALRGWPLQAVGGPTYGRSWWVSPRAAYHLNHPQDCGMKSELSHVSPSFLFIFLINDLNFPPGKTYFP